MQDEYTVGYASGTIIQSFPRGDRFEMPGHGMVDDGWSKAVLAAVELSRREPTSVLVVRDPDGVTTGEYVDGLPR